MPIHRKSVIGAVVTLAALLASSAVLADGRRHHRSGPRVGISIGIGVPLYRPYVWPSPFFHYHYPAPLYAYPPVVIRPEPQVYIEQAQPLAQAPQAPAPQVQQGNPGDWFYCSPARAYYPYVNECSEPWQRVPAVPPANSAPR